MVTAGRFAIPREQGLTAGVYKVVIRSKEPIPVFTLPPPGKNLERIGERYNERSELTVEVTPGSGVCSFEFKVE
jgi:hypothetical protein